MLDKKSGGTLCACRLFGSRVIRSQCLMISEVAIGPIMSISQRTQPSRARRTLRRPWSSVPRKMALTKKNSVIVIVAFASKAKMWCRQKMLRRKAVSPIGRHSMVANVISRNACPPSSNLSTTSTLGTILNDRVLTIVSPWFDVL